MSFLYDGSNDTHSIPNIASIGNFTVFFWAYPVTNTVNDNAFGWDNYPDTPRDELTFKPLDSSGDTAKWGANVNGTGGTTTGTIWSTGSWHNSSATRSGATVTVYLDNASQGTITVDAAATFTAANIRFGCHYHSGSNQEFCNIRIAEWALWNVVLTAGELASLNVGLSPLLVRPQNLLRYIPFVRNLIELISGATISTVDAPAIANHSRIIYPAPVHFNYGEAAAPPAGNAGIMTTNTGFWGATY